MRVPVLVLLLALPCLAEDRPTSGPVTERDRGLDRALDILLTGGQGGRSLVFLIDPTESLKEAQFDAAFREALLRNARRLEETRIGVLRVPVRERPSLHSIDEAATITGRVEQIVASPKKAVQNVYAAVRKASGGFGSTPGAREIVLVTLENGDAEDDLEGTVKALRRAKVRLSVIAREAFLSDSYWKRYRHTTLVRHDLHGGDSAFIEMPYGWLFQGSIANESVPSGFAMYGLTRLAHESKGRVFLHYPVAGGHDCKDHAWEADCPFCEGDHLPAWAGYRVDRLRALAPLVTTRREAHAAAARDPYFRALLRAWGRAAKLDLVQAPHVKLSGGTLKARASASWKTADVGYSTAFDSEANRAERLLAPCTKILSDLEADLRSAEKTGGMYRYRAAAEYARVMLHVTRVNIRGYVLFCRELAPRMVAARPRDFLPPETPVYALDREERERWDGIHWICHSICHGIRPFAELHLPGGEKMASELSALEREVSGFYRRFAHTPFAVALSRAAIASFYLTVEGRPYQRRYVGSSKTDDAETKKERPRREGTSSEESGGPTSGG
ncbi:MAG: vWA domain-containing protein [Planctomycetota bacterium]|jgi:hypothetical protein